MPISVRHPSCVGNGPEEVVREALTRYFAGEQDAAWALFDDEVIATPPRQFPESGAIRGKEALERALHLSWGMVFGDDWPSKMALREVIRVDDRRAIAVTNFDPSGVRSGVPIETSPAAIYEVEESRIVALQMYLSAEDAQKAAGIE